MKSPGNHRNCRIVNQDQHTKCTNCNEAWLTEDLDRAKCSEYRTWIDRLRMRMFKFAWRLNFIGRMMEKSRCDYSTAKRRAHEAIAMHPDWYHYDGAQLADERIERLGYLYIKRDNR